MQLNDLAIRALLPELNIDVQFADYPFSPDDQVQPASLDLRLGTVFWKPIRRFAIDLRKSKLLEIQPRRYYRKMVVHPGQSITLKPRELLLARTLEKFSIPNGYAANLLGRSSFSRLGLQVSLAGGYINPGWRGHMPLQLVNFGPNSVRLFPGLPICQVIFTQLTAPAQREYGHPELASIYTDDDGGPSYWWRDKRINNLQKTLNDQLVEHRIQREVYEIIGEREPEVVERLEKYVGKLRLDDLQNCDHLLDTFSRLEDRRRTRRKWFINIAKASFTVGISASFFVSRITPFRWWHWVVWTLSLCLFALSIYAQRTEVGEHFGVTELKVARTNRRST